MRQNPMNGTAHEQANTRQGQVSMLLIIATLLILTTIALLTFTREPRVEKNTYSSIPEGLKTCLEVSFEHAITTTLAHGGSILPATTPSIAKQYYTLQTRQGSVFTILHRAPIHATSTPGTPIRQPPLIPPLNGMLPGPPPLPGVNESIAHAWKRRAEQPEDQQGCGIIVQRVSVTVHPTRVEGRMRLLANNTPLSIRVTRSYPFEDVYNALTAFALLNTASPRITLPIREDMRITFENNAARSALNPHVLHGVVHITPAYGRLPLTNTIPTLTAGVEDQYPIITTSDCARLTPHALHDPDGDAILRAEKTGCTAGLTHAETLTLTLRDTNAQGDERVYTVTYDFTRDKVILS